MVHKLFQLLKEDLSQQGLVMVAVWTIGELGEYLIMDSPAVDEETPFYPAQTPKAIIDLLERVLRDHNCRAPTRAYVLTTLMKLADRLRGAERQRLEELLTSFSCSMTLELQQRSCEFLRLLDPSVERLRPELLSRIPALDEATLKARRARFAEENTDGTSSPRSPRSPSRNPAANGDVLGFSPARPTSTTGPSAASGGGDLLDLDDIFGAGPPAPAPSKSSPRAAMPPAAPSSSGADLLSDIFSSPAPQPTHLPTANALADMFGGPSMSLSSPSPYPPMDHSGGMGLAPMGMGLPPLTAEAPRPSITAFEKDGLLLSMDLAKPTPDPQTSHITCRFVYAGAAPLTNLVFQCAVPKYVKLEMSPASGTVVPPNREGALEQVVKVTNTMLGQKPLQLKIKIQYSLNGQQVTEMGQVSNFPPGY